MVDCMARRGAWSSNARPAQQYGHDSTTGRILSIVAPPRLLCLHTAAPRTVVNGRRRAAEDWSFPLKARQRIAKDDCATRTGRYHMCI